MDENVLLKLVNEKVPKAGAEEDKSHWKRSYARAKRRKSDILRPPLTNPREKVTWKPRPREGALMKEKSSVEVEGDKSHWRKSDARARRILLDSISDHLVPQISQKKMTRKMFKTLME